MTSRETEHVSDEMLMALADGELDDMQASALRARVERDPDLAARYAIFSETATALQAAFAQDEIPERLIEAINAPHGQDSPDETNVVPLRRRVLAWPVALAAALSIGIGLGWSLKGGNTPDAATGLNDVAQLLSDTPTGATLDIEDMGPARVLGSFETDRGLCRVIVVESADTVSNRLVACRDSAGWAVALSVSAPTGDGYTPASAAGTEMIDHYLDSIGAGPALDPQTETDRLQ